MSDRSGIEWTEATWNPIVAAEGQGRWFCRRISPGCDWCYASGFNVRFGGPAYLTVGSEGHGVGQAVLSQRHLIEPRRWRNPRHIFVCSMTDLFGEWVPDTWLDAVFDVME